MSQKMKVGEITKRRNVLKKNDTVWVLQCSKERLTFKTKKEAMAWAKVFKDIEAFKPKA